MLLNLNVCCPSTPGKTSDNVHFSRSTECLQHFNCALPVVFSVSGEESKEEGGQRSLGGCVPLFGGSSPACLKPQVPGPLLVKSNGLTGDRQPVLQGLVFVVLERFHDFVGKSFLDKISKLSQLVSHDYPCRMGIRLFVWLIECRKR